MKKLISILALVFILTLASAFATYEVTSPSFGGEDQERGQTVQISVPVKNTGTKNISGIAASFSGVDGDYSAEVVSVPASIAVNGTENVVIKAYVPLDFDAVDSKGKKVSAGIGNLVLEGNYSDNSAVAQKSVSMTMEAENLLEFKDNRITIGDRSDKSLDNRDEFDDVKRNDKVLIEIELENDFSDDGDCDDPDDYGDCAIEDVEVEFEPDDSDFDDESIDFNDVNADDTDTETFSFSVPDDVDDSTYEFEMWVTGTDENGARHGEYMTFRLEVDVPRDEVTITDAYLSPSSIDCDDRHTTLRVTIENTGRDDQSKASIFVTSTKLDIKQSVYNIDVDEGDTASKTFDLRLEDDVTPGQYTITVTSNYDNSDESDIDSVTLTVKECKTVVPDDDDDDDSNTDVNVIEVPPSTGVIYGDEKEPSFFESNQYLLMLGGLFLVALFMFFILIVAILRK